MKIKHYTFSGSSYDQGHLHGKKLKNYIDQNIKIYFNRFYNEAGITKSELLLRASKYLEVIKYQNKEYLEGMHGISEGSEINILKIAMLNFRYELLYDAVGKRYIESASDGCTSFAILSKKTANNHIIIGQNWDWIPNINCILVTSIDNDGLQRISFVEAGIFGGKPGMNSNGVSIAVNGMYSTKDNWKRLEKPFHVRCYEALRSKNMNSAIKQLSHTHRSCSVNFIVGDPSSGVINLELAPKKMRIIYPKNNILSHANHFINPKLLGISEPNNPRRYLSEFRQKHLEYLLTSKKHIDISFIKKVLRNHQNKPQSICRHKDTSLKQCQYSITKTAMIMDLCAKKLWVTYKQPCKTKFKEFNFC